MCVEMAHVQQVIKVLIAAMQKCLHDGALYGLSLLLGNGRCLLSPVLCRWPNAPMTSFVWLGQQRILVANQPQHILQIHVCDRVCEARHLYRGKLVISDHQHRCHSC